MPSDERVTEVLAVVGPAIEAFRTTVRLTADQVRRHLVTEAGPETSRADQARAGLGPFGARYLDASRFDELTTAAAGASSRMTLDSLQRALETLNFLADLEPEAMTVARVSEGGDVAAGVGRVLEQIGRAFGAARTVEQARIGVNGHPAHARSLGAYPFARWNRLERRLAPPVVATVDGSTLAVGGLERLLDGAQKIVLIVTGPTSPAPLARLITPGVFVQQASNANELGRFLAFAGPGIAALVESEAALFVHDPAAGTTTWERLTITRPSSPPRRSMSGLSAAQLTEELRHLDALATPPSLPTSATADAASAPPADPADRLAAWLLRQAQVEVS